MILILLYLCTLFFYNTQKLSCLTYSAVLNLQIDFTVPLPVSLPLLLALSFSTVTIPSFTLTSCITGHWLLATLSPKIFKVLSYFGLLCLKSFFVFHILVSMLIQIILPELSPLRYRLWV